MPTYILLSTLTPEGRRTLHSDPDRLDEVNQEITDLAAKLSVNMRCSAPATLSLSSKRRITNRLHIYRSPSAHAARSASSLCQRLRWRTSAES